MNPAEIDAANGLMHRARKRLQADDPSITGFNIGTNAGKVIKIDRHKVIVSEEIEDVTGKVKIRNTELKLPKPPGEL